MDWDKVRIFHAVAEAGSFTHAGETLHLSQSAISRQISSLEEDLKVQLFRREPRGLSLTEQGDLLYRAAREISGRMKLAETLLADSTEKPAGDLRVTTTVGFGSIWLTPRMKEFSDHYPDIKLHLTVSDDSVDLGMHLTHVAIRMRPPTQADLIQRMLLGVHFHAYASPEYLAKHGTPGTAEELDDHFLLGYEDTSQTPVDDINWLWAAGASDAKERNIILEVNNVYALLLAVESGMGIASLPDYMVRENPRVTRVLPDVHGPTAATYFVYPEELRNSKRVQVFRDFLIQKVAEWEF